MVERRLSPKVIVWSFFRLYGRSGATLSQVAKRLGNCGLIRGDQLHAIHVVTKLIGAWEQSRGSHRKLVRVSRVRYRAEFTDR